MNGANEERRIPVRRGLGRRGMSPTTAAVIFVVTIVAVGAVGYVVLNAVGTGGKSTSTSCSPSTAPQCGGPAKSSTVVAAPAHLSELSSHSLRAAVDLGVAS